MKINEYDDLQQIELEVGFGNIRMLVYVYFIDGMLIDTGPSNKFNELKDWLDRQDISQVVLTHHHEDHTGAANWLQKYKCVPVFSHETGVALNRSEMKLPFYRKVFWGERQPFESAVIGKYFETPNYQWETIHTPGHADDHIALLNREKGWMFGGDLYIQSSPKSLFAFESIPGIVQSLKKMLAYEFDVYICSHAGILPEGRALLNNKLAYLEDVQFQVMHLAQQGFTAREIRKQLFPKRHPMHFLSFFENSPQHIVDSILEPTL